MLEGGTVSKLIKAGDPISLESVELPENLINELRKKTKELINDLGQKIKKLELFRIMLLIRMFEEALEEMFSEVFCMEQCIYHRTRSNCSGGMPCTN